MRLLMTPAARLLALATLLTIAACNPPTVSFIADRLSITQGESAELTWSVAAAPGTSLTSVEIVPEVGAAAPTGSATVAPTETTTYTLTARSSGAGGSFTETAELTIEVLPAPPIVCETDDVSGLPASGFLAGAQITDVVPLCSGEVLLADATASAVRRVNVSTGAELERFELTPGANTGYIDLELDGARGLVYVAGGLGFYIATVDLADGTVSQQTVTGTPDRVRLGPDGLAYFMINATAGNRIHPFDPDTGTLGDPIGTLDRGLFVYSESADTVIGGQDNLIPSSYRRFTFNVDGNLVQQQQASCPGPPGNRGADLALDPDGEHFVYVCQNGNDIGTRRIHDRPVDDILGVDGTWTLGGLSPLGAAAFDRTGTLFLGADLGGFLELFDRESYASLGSHAALPDEDCASPFLLQVDFSRGSEIAYALRACNGPRDVTRVHWWVLP